VHDLSGAAGGGRQERGVATEVTVARHLVVRGRVQGVFFRASTRDQARSHGVAGWVRNRADGAVEAWLEGPESAVERVTGWIAEGGPPFAVVEHLDSEVVDPEGHVGFVVRHDGH
jgi:acylphosphatase